MKDSKFAYFGQIDSLRFLAATSIVCLHWFNDNYLETFGFDQSYDLEFGKYGVQLFFVISGFLITNILMKFKGQSKKTKVIGSFFMRRVLRLFPIYFLFLFVLILFKDEFVKNEAGWYFTYLVNWKFYLSESMPDIWSNHLWTLSIEEQFYLIFPLTFLLVPKRAEYFFAVLLILVGLSSKFYLHSINQPFFEMNTLTQLDTLGTGILLAIMFNNQSELFQKLQPKSWLLIGTTLLIITAFIFYAKFESSPMYLVQSFMLCASFFLILGSSLKDYTGIVGKAMNNKNLMYLGKISYGIYLYHKIIPLVLVIVLNKLGFEIPNLVVYFFVNAIILFLVSHFSWKLLETKILRLKKYFNYV